MAFVGVNVLRRIRFGSVNVRLCKPVTKSSCVSSRFSWQRPAVRAAPVRPPLVVCGSVRTLCCLQRSPGRVWLHTSVPLRALPAPLLWLLVKPLQKITAIILGRSLRKWWGTLPANRKQLLRETLRQHQWQLVTCAAVAMAVVALFVFTHLDEVPMTGRIRLVVFSRETYMELAAVTSEEYMKKFEDLLVPEHDPSHQMVDQVVQHLLQRNKDIPELSAVTWNVHVVQNPQINAFVLPVSQLYYHIVALNSSMRCVLPTRCALSDWLLKPLNLILCKSSMKIDENNQYVPAASFNSQKLCAFFASYPTFSFFRTPISFSYSPALSSHILPGPLFQAEKASFSHAVDMLSLILLTAIWAVCPRDSLALLVQWVQDKLVQLTFDRPYSRSLEAEADKVGLQLAAKACADVRAGPVFWQQMEMRDQLSGGPAIPEWLSTHPSHRNRLAQLYRLIPQAVELRKSCGCPALPPTDPRDVFSKSVHVFLEKTKAQGRRYPEGVLKPLPHSFALLPTGSSTVLLDQSPQCPSTNIDMENKVQVLASQSVGVTPVPAPGEGDGHSQSVPGTS
ncbi:metalloendopeptidase OMA1, mitochondrial [Thalassophryne amazonica]|uniref:metalloendopeptidase OMA1, mitochondrial n=1 Tax=Thalassophryne amazonica TaxID=390379 RepID=UPI001470AC1E|nr:metalloendopeptidase OMA1, mitochondrial [Thalassophryne amazonica]